VRPFLLSGPTLREAVPSALCLTARHKVGYKFTPIAFCLIERQMGHLPNRDSGKKSEAIAPNHNRLLYHFIVISMGTNPYPYDTLYSFFSYCPITNAYPSRPIRAHFLQSNRRMARVILQKRKVFVGQILNSLR
jgi:hypothetical protein